MTAEKCEKCGGEGGGWIDGVGSQFVKCGACYGAGNGAPVDGAGLITAEIDRLKRKSNG